MHDGPDFGQEEFALVGLVDDRFRRACLEWFGCSEEELWSAIAAVGISSVAVQDYLQRRRRGESEPPAT